MSNWLARGTSRPLSDDRSPRHTDRRITSYVYRKAVATLMAQAGLIARQAADQLGHAKVSMTQDNYFGRKAARTGAAPVLEQVAESAPVPPNSGGKCGAASAETSGSGL